MTSLGLPAIFSTFFVTTFYYGFRIVDDRTRPGVDVIPVGDGTIRVFSFLGAVEVSSLAQ